MPNGTILLYVCMSLKPGRDDDLIVALVSTPLGQLSGKLREMLRTGLSSGRFLAEEEAQPISVEMGNVGIDI